MRRIGCFFAAILATAVLAGAVLGGLVARLGGWPVAVLAIVFVALLVAAGAGAARRMTRPMNSLIDAAGRIEAGDYGVQVAERGPRELRTLARAFNEPGGRIDTRGFNAALL